MSISFDEHYAQVRIGRYNNGDANISTALNIQGSRTDTYKFVLKTLEKQMDRQDAYFNQYADMKKKDKKNPSSAAQILQVQQIQQMYSRKMSGAKMAMRKNEHAYEKYRDIAKSLQKAKHRLIWEFGQKCQVEEAIFDVRSSLVECQLPSQMRQEMEDKLYRLEDLIVKNRRRHLVILRKHNKFMNDQRVVFPSGTGSSSRRSTLPQGLSLPVEPSWLQEYLIQQEALEIEKLQENSIAGRCHPAIVQEEMALFDRNKNELIRRTLMRENLAWEERQRRLKDRFDTLLRANENMFKSMESISNNTAIIPNVIIDTKDRSPDLDEEYVYEEVPLTASSPEGHTSMHSMMALSDFGNNLVTSTVRLCIRKKWTEDSKMKDVQNIIEEDVRRQNALLAVLNMQDVSHWSEALSIAQKAPPNVIPMANPALNRLKGYA